MALNIVVQLTQSERQFRDVVIEQSLILDPRKSPVLREIPMVHYYKLTGLDYREKGGRMVTMFFSDGVWYNFDGGKVMRSDAGKRLVMLMSVQRNYCK